MLPFWHYWPPTEEELHEMWPESDVIARGVARDALHEAVPSAKFWQNGDEKSGIPPLLLLLLDMAYGRPELPAHLYGRRLELTRVHVVTEPAAFTTQLYRIPRSSEDLRIWLCSDRSQGGFIRPSAGTRTYEALLGTPFSAGEYGPYNTEEIFALCIYRHEELYVYPAPPTWPDIVKKVCSSLRSMSERQVRALDLEDLLTDQIEWLGDEQVITALVKIVGHQRVEEIITTPSR